MTERPRGWLMTYYRIRRLRRAKLGFTRSEPLWLKLVSTEPPMVINPKGTLNAEDIWLNDTLSQNNIKTALFRGNASLPDDLNEQLERIDDILLDRRKKKVNTEQYLRLLLRRYNWEMTVI